MKTATLASIALAISISAAHAETIGVSMSGLDKFRTALLNGVVSHGQTISGLKLVTENANGDKELQKQQVQSSLPTRSTRSFLPSPMATSGRK